MGSLGFKAYGVQAGRWKAFFRNIREPLRFFVKGRLKPIENPLNGVYGPLSLRGPLTCLKGPWKAAL